MAEVTRESVEAAIKGYIEPHLETDLVSVKSVKDVAIDGGKVSVDIVLGFPAKGVFDIIAAAVKSAVEAVDGVSSCEVKVSSKVVAHSVQKSLKPIDNVKNIIAVASGKGGVGKSTTAVNLALALKDRDLKVGILDADIYGPSMPRLLGLSGQPQQLAGNKLDPMRQYGLKVMSMGFLVDEDTPMIWRGPMVISALSQMLKDVAWGELDVLVVDMPPGTGDAQLTMAQQVPLAGAVIVSTPQDLALIDARKGLNMFKKVNVPVLGIVENMSTFLCPHCGGRSDIFGHGGAKAEAAKLGVPFLGEVPLTMSVRETSDDGKPILVSQPDSEVSSAYRDIAAMAWAEIQRTSSAAKQAPKIVVES